MAMAAVNINPTDAASLQGRREIKSALESASDPAPLENAK